MLDKAIYNNALWCDTICRAHGVPGEFHETLWVNRHTVPLFYSNLITLSNHKSEQVQRNMINSLFSAGKLQSWSVKDSYGCLDLSDLGFEELFEATWIWYSPDRELPRKEGLEINWSGIHEEADLVEWEAAWSGNSANTSPTPQPRLWVPKLLKEKDLMFLAGRMNGEIVAVGVTNRSGDVIGLSNVFARLDLGGAHWYGCINKVRESFPGMPIVGYERGEDLFFAKKMGFEPLQDLTVWNYTS